MSEENLKIIITFVSPSPIFSVSLLSNGCSCSKNKQTHTAVLDLMNGSRLYEGFLLLTYNNKIICLNGTCEMCMQLIFYC